MMNLPLHDMWSTKGDVPPVHRKLSVTTSCRFSAVTFSRLVACLIHWPRCITEWVRKGECFYVVLLNSHTSTVFSAYMTHTCMQ